MFLLLLSIIFLGNVFTFDELLALAMYNMYRAVYVVICCPCLFNGWMNLVADKRCRDVFQMNLYENIHGQRVYHLNPALTNVGERNEDNTLSANHEESWFQSRMVWYQALWHTDWGIWVCKKVKECYVFAIEVCTLMWHYDKSWNDLSHLPWMNLLLRDERNLLELRAKNLIFDRYLHRCYFYGK